VYTERVGSRTEKIISVDADEWAEMEPQERNQYMLDEMLQSGLIEWGYEERPK